MYHVIGTSITATLLYLISYFFYRAGYYSIQFHRKLWNSLLALAFLLTVIAGLFMALQVTYKWNITFVKTILKWHVEFGIGLAVTGVFHLLWHLSYFGKIFRKSAENIETIALPKLTPSEIGTNLFIVGFVSTALQLLLIREMMNIAGGYELITGTFLGSWLIGSAVGASLAGRSSLIDLKRINLIFSLSPLASITLLFLLSVLFLGSGETPSFLLSIIYTFLVLIPFCLVSGFTFVRLISVARSVNDFVPGKSFSIETAGGILSGILIPLLTAGIMNTWQLVLITILFANFYVFVTFWSPKPGLKSAARFLTLLLAIFLINGKPDNFFRHILLPGMTITTSEDTPYGNITKGKYKGEESTFYNQRLLSYKNDVAEREENVHYAMLQNRSPETVILISGVLQTHLPELMKYPLKKVIYIERDPVLAKSAEFSKDSLHAQLLIENNDAFRYIRNSQEKADVIILLIPPPSTLLLNRYYTTEFFSEVKKRLNPGGVFMCSPGPGDNYMNKESLNLYSSVFNSLASVFKNVLPIAGNKLYFIASNEKLTSSICQMVEMRKIKNIYVSRDFLADDLIKNKSDEIASLIDRGVRQNTSSFPVACFHFQSYNFSKNLNEKVPSLALMVLLFLFPGAAIKKRNRAMYFSASALAGFEIIVLLTIQMIIGNMYQITGLILAGLMAGLAIGAGFDLQLMSKFSLRIKFIILMCYYAGIGMIFQYMLEIRHGFPALSLLVLSAFLPAFVTGNIFRELTIRNNNGSATAATYSADLAGSAFGFIMISGLAIPSLGIKGSVYLISGLILAGILFGAVKNKS